MSLFRLGQVSNPGLDSWEVSEFATKPLGLLHPNRMYIPDTDYLCQGDIIFMTICWSVGLYMCIYVCWRVLGHNFGAKILISFHITLSFVRIEYDQISTKSVAYSYSYDHFSYLATAFTNMQQDFEVYNSDEWIYLFVG